MRVRLLAVPSGRHAGWAQRPVQELHVGANDRWLWRQRHRGGVQIFVFEALRDLSTVTCVAWRRTTDTVVKLMPHLTWQPS